MAESCKDRFIHASVHLYQNTKLLIQHLEAGQERLREAMRNAPVRPSSFVGVNLAPQERHFQSLPSKDPWEWRFEDLLHHSQRQSSILHVHMEQAKRVVTRSRELAPSTPGRLKRINRREGGRPRGHHCQLGDGKWVVLGDFVEFKRTGLTNGGIGRVTKITPSSFLVIQRVGKKFRVDDGVVQREVRRSAQTCSRVEAAVRG